MIQISSLQTHRKFNLKRKMRSQPCTMMLDQQGALADLLAKSPTKKSAAKRAQFKKTGKQKVMAVVHKIRAAGIWGKLGIQLQGGEGGMGQ